MSNNISRAEFLKAVAAGAASMCLPGNLFAQKSPAQRLNVLFIFSDDLNDWIGCLGGHPDSRTPNIDRLCERGVLFENAYCSAPICNPSRASLLTGMHPSTTGVYDNRQPFRLSEIGKTAVTLPQHFMSNGYYAAGAGKIFHGKFPDPDSWNDFYPALDNQNPPTAKPPHKHMNGMTNVGNIDWGPLNAEDSEMGDYKSVQYCIDQLNKAHEKPFFLACGIRKPHLPWYVPRKYFERYPVDQVTLPIIEEDDLNDVPEIARNWANAKIHQKIAAQGKWREGVAAYLSTIAWVDEQVGRLLDALDKSRYSQNTMIIFLGDHGWHLAEKLHWKKSTLWEEATHAPLMISIPGVTAVGNRCPQPVSFLDLYPTVTEACGLPQHSETEGRSLLPLLVNPMKIWEYPAVTTYRRGNHSVRSKKWRYTRYIDGTEELYNHDKDELEWVNLADDPQYFTIKKELARWLPEKNAPDAPHVVWPGDNEKDEDEMDGE